MSNFVYRLAGWWVTGPRYNGVVFVGADLESEIETIAAIYGDDSDDYTATELFVRAVSVDLGFNSPADIAARGEK